MKKKVICITIILMFITIEVSHVSSKSLVLNIQDKIEGTIDSIETAGFGSNCAIIICGGINDHHQEEYRRTAEHSRGVLQSYGYIMPDNGIYEGILYQPTLDEVRNAISFWLPKNLGFEPKQVFIHIMDHGDKPGVYLNPDNEILDYYFLNTYLASISSKHLVTILIDTCRSGYAIEILSKENRIIMTSTNHLLTMSSLNFDKLPFSEGFFNQIALGKTYGEAWEKADKKVFGIWGLSGGVNPQIDDNGDGKGSGTFLPDKLINLDDGDLASRVKANTDASKITKNKHINLRRNVFEMIIKRFNIIQFNLKNLIKMKISDINN